MIFHWFKLCTWLLRFLLQNFVANLQWLSDFWKLLQFLFLSQDFYFRQLRKVKVGDPAVGLEGRHSLLCTSNEFGLTFVGCSDGKLEMLTLSLRKLVSESKKEWSSQLVEGDTAPRLWAHFHCCSANLYSFHDIQAACEPFSQLPSCLASFQIVWPSFYFILYN